MVLKRRSFFTLFQCKKLLTTDAYIARQQHATDLLAYDSQFKEKCLLPAGRNSVVTTYICGPTVYDSMHLGHAFVYTQFDIIKRITEQLTGRCMLTCMNITDIDDKIIKRAATSTDSIKWHELADKYEQEFWTLLSILGVRRPEIVAPVLKYMPVIINYVDQLIADGHAYVRPSGNVYFDLAKCGSRYGLFREATGIEPGAEWVDQDAGVLKEKKQQIDFAVWKQAKPHVFGPDEPLWSVPWNENHRGRPGWHTECAALCSYFFGQHVDIHCGGIDLRFPHHENESAQNMCFHNHQSNNKWAQHWLHFGTLFNAQGQKMSKSEHNYTSVREFVEQYGSDAGRLWRTFCCLNHYRSNPRFYTDTDAAATPSENEDTSDSSSSSSSYRPKISSMRHAGMLLDTFQQYRSLLNSYLAGRLPVSSKKNVANDELSTTLSPARIQDVEKQVLLCLLDDFNVPGALQLLSELVKQVSAQLSMSVSGAIVPRQFMTLNYAVPLTTIMHMIDSFYNLLGFHDSAAAASTAAAGSASNNPSYSQTYVERLVDDAVNFRSRVRQTAFSSDITKEHKKQLLTSCDSLRDQLARTSGITVRDTKAESFWMFGSPTMPTKKDDKNSSTDTINKKIIVAKQQEKVESY